MPKLNKTHGQLDHRYSIGDANQVVFQQRFFIEMTGLPKKLEESLIGYCKKTIPNAPNTWAYHLSSEAHVLSTAIQELPGLTFQQTIFHASQDHFNPHTEIDVEIRLADLEYVGTFVKRTVQWRCQYFGSFNHPEVKRLPGKTEQVILT